MIHDLDKTLETLLKQELPPDLVQQVTISFATPDEHFPPTAVTLPAIDLFLYDVRENLDLRTKEWIIDRRGDGTVTKQRPPARVDCSYLITVWPSASAPNPAQDEHRVLSEVMIVLLRHATLPDAVLQGSLQGQTPALPTIVLHPGNLQSIAEFWQALGGKPKAALHCTVTIGVTVQAPVEAGPPVKEKQLILKQTTKE